LGEVLPDCGTSSVGIVDAGALLPASESPAALNTVAAAALRVCLCVEPCFTRDMVASSKSSCESTRTATLRAANAPSKRSLCSKAANSREFPFIFMNETRQLFGRGNLAPD
jgi:hypothetical protein